MNEFICPFCKHAVAGSEETITTYGMTFSEHISSRDYYSPLKEGVHETPYLIHVIFQKCPVCEEQSIVINGIGTKVKDISGMVYPSSSAKKYPDYIPEQIRRDYEEASAVLHISPKASATLSRRCLQGMIRDFWDVHERKTLAQEIEAIKDKISPQARKALDATRELGNIGAHMEQDVNMIIDISSDEAHALVKLIELLIKEWYINRHESDELLKELTEINEVKQACKM